MTTVEEVPVYRKANYLVLMTGGPPVPGRVTAPSKITVPNTSTFAVKATLLPPIK